ncbi:MAG: Ig-like domain-containing protein, partial [Chloroflexi bacterium]|nr:Ig-like domain-containing protein [Chloroflexota bacterium]
LTISYGTDGTQLVDLTATDWGNGSDDEKAVQLWRDPIVTSHTPVDGVVDVGVDTAVSVSWSLPMDAGTVFNVVGPAGAVTGTFSYDAGTDTTTFTPDADLTKGVTYDVTVTGQVSNGNFQQAPVVFSFTTVQPTPQEMIDALIADINQLVVDGELYSQDAKKLIFRLERAKKFVDFGLDWVAVNQMNAFVKNVNRVVNAGRLAPEFGIELVDAGQAIIDRINE